MLLIAFPYILVINNRKKVVILPSIDKEASPKKLIHEGRQHNWQVTLTFPESLMYLSEILKITLLKIHENSLSSLFKTRNQKSNVKEVTQ